MQFPNRKLLIFRKKWVKMPVPNPKTEILCYKKNLMASHRNYPPATPIRTVDIEIGYSSKEGFVKVIGKDGKSYSQLSIDEYGGVVSARGKDGKGNASLAIGEYGGGVIAKGKDGKSEAQLNINEYGGVLAIFNDSGQNCFHASITDIGSGIIETKDKSGNRTERLP